MKFSKRIIHEDKELLKGFSLTQLMKLTGWDKAYLSRIRSGKLIVTEKQYQELKKLVGKIGA